MHVVLCTKIGLRGGSCMSLISPPRRYATDEGRIYYANYFVPTSLNFNVFVAALIVCKKQWGLHWGHIILKLVTSCTNAT